MAVSGDYIPMMGSMSSFHGMRYRASVPSLADEQKEAQDFIRILFDEKCVICLTPSRVVHEIEPKSKRPRDWWDVSNMVVLCNECHERVHLHLISQDFLQEKRRQALGSW
jgi:5-methylcytosine-specific restriction endonuclease McrA